MRTNKRTYLVEVAFLNMESDDINVEYVESIGDNERQVRDYAVDYISKLPYANCITVISIERK